MDMIMTARYELWSTNGEIRSSRSASFLWKLETYGFQVLISHFEHFLFRINCLRGTVPIASIKVMVHFDWKEMKKGVKHMITYLDIKQLPQTQVIPVKYI